MNCLFCFHKKNILLWILLCGSLIAHSQQLPRFSQYAYNNHLINPAVVGTKDYSEFKAGTRLQWENINGSPNSGFANISLKKTNGSANKSILKNHGFGAIILYDRNNILDNTYFSLSYAYHIKIADDLSLSSGVNVGIINTSIDKNNIIVSNLNDPVITNLQERTRGDLSLGLWLNSSRYYVGLSAMNILESGLEVNQQISYPRHLFLTAGFLSKIGNFELLSSTLIYTTLNSNLLSTYQVDLNLLAKVGIINFGVSYRLFSDIGVMAGINFSKNRFMLSYSYDYSTNFTQNFQNGSHEVMLTIRMIKDRRTPCPIKFYE